MKVHWTERNIKDYLFRITADFIAQLEKKMESLNIPQDELAKRLKITKGRVSQIFNHPGNVTLANIVKYARTLGMKVSIVAYEDDDPENRKGPINSEVFQICWEKSGKPRDFWGFQEIQKETAANTTSSVICVSDFVYFQPFPGGMIGENFVNLPRYRVLETAVPMPGNIQNQDQLFIN
jgi:transcriptional regulator with XRE-family HTH domain